jgi:hypothetical protein
MLDGSDTANKDVLANGRITLTTVVPPVLGM